MEKQVFTLRFLDQLEIKEIGLALKKNESTIKTHLYRAISKFKNTEGLRDLLSGA
jgi:RNA polymerase sigma-70 factor (ECF subfamily)